MLNGSTDTRPTTLAHVLETVCERRYVSRTLNLANLNDCWKIHCFMECWKARVMECMESSGGSSHKNWGCYAPKLLRSSSLYSSLTRPPSPYRQLLHQPGKTAH